MNKTEFIKAIAAKAGTSAKAAGEFYNAYVEVLAEALKKGDKVTLVGFGTYEAKKVAAHTAINPMTKAKVKVPATVKPALKFGKAFKEAIAK